MPTKEETELNQIRKLESNKACVNCDTVAKLGHGHVCEKYNTFVCSLCKSAHQAYSMRVKSITMSNWTQAEVDKLKAKYGGGNDAARNTWLAHWSPSIARKPTKDDHLNYFKQFISRVYIDKEFYDANGVVGVENDDFEPKVSRKVKKVISVKPKENGEVIDLLGFGDSSEAATNSNPVEDFADFSTSKAGDSNTENFAGFSSDVRITANDFADFSNTESTVSNGTNFDPFGTSGLASTLPTNTPQHHKPLNQVVAGSWDAFGTNNAPAPTVTSHDPFSFVPTTTGNSMTNNIPPAKPPIMNNSYNNTIGMMSSNPYNNFSFNSQMQPSMTYQQSNIGLPQSMPYGSTPQANFGMVQQSNPSYSMYNSQINGNVMYNQHPQMVGTTGNKINNGNLQSGSLNYTPPGSNRDPFAGLSGL